MRIRFKYDRRRANEVILWFIDRQGGTVDKIKLIKLIFFADLKHLQQYGRPIVGGTYCAMDFGPVCSELYDDIKRSQRDEALPYRTKEGGHSLNAVSLPVGDLLSESDLEILESVNSEFGKMDTFRLSDITHQLKLWKKHFSAGTSVQIPYEDFFSDPEKECSEMLEIIKEDQIVRDLLGG